MSIIRLMESLFLNPNINRTRYPIGWNGNGRYIYNTLTVIDIRTNTKLDIIPESNGIFFNLKEPIIDGSYKDYIVQYDVNIEDYEFSKGIGYSKYLKEEYHLFPNWNNIPGYGDAFWIGKYYASQLNKNDIIPISNCNSIYPIIDMNFYDAKYIIENKGYKFHILRDVEYLTILDWYHHMNYNIDTDLKDIINTNIYEWVDGIRQHNIVYTDVIECWNSNHKYITVKDIEEFPYDFKHIEDYKDLKITFCKNIERPLYYKQIKNIECYKHGLRGGINKDNIDNIRFRICKDL